MSAQLLAQPSARRTLRHLGERRELRVEQAREVVERHLVAGMRRGGEKEHVPRRLRFGEGADELVALVAGASVGANAAVRFVDHDELGAGAQEIGAAPLGLDVIERDDRERMHLEDRFVRPEAAFQAGCGAGPHDLGFDVELASELGLPLLAEMRRADHGAALDLAAVEQFAHDEPRLDRLADPDIVGDQESHHRLLERHQERHELIGARLEAELAEAAEGSGAGARLQAQRIAQQEGRGLRAGFFRIGRGKAGWLRRLRLERKEDQRGVLLAAAERAQLEEVRAAFRQHHPFPTSQPDEAARPELWRSGHRLTLRVFRRGSRSVASSVPQDRGPALPLPHTQAYSAKIAGHRLLSGGKRTTV